MGTVKAKYEGTCGICKGKFKPGDRINVEKGKQPTHADRCPRVGVAGPKEKPATTKTLWDEYALESLRLRPQEIFTPVAAATFADQMMVERAKRGMK